MRLTFLACAERGYLEQQSLLLCRSIRAHAGEFATADIHVFSPRSGQAVSRATADVLESLDVHVHDEELNTAFADKPILNKVVVSAWAEEHLDADVLVFVDSDSVFVNPPLELLQLPGAAALRPVDSQNVGSTGPGDATADYWAAVRRACGVGRERVVETTVGGVRIEEYYNAGLVASHRSGGFFTDWLRCLTLLVDGGLRPPDGRWTFVDQVALAAAAGRAQEVVVLPPTYNYPLPKRPLLDEPWRSVPLDDLVHVHYHRWFARPGFLEELTPPVDPGRVADWLRPQLPLEPVHHTPLRFGGR